MRDGHPTHRMTKSPTYRSWSEMKYRVRNPRHHEHHRYGGRGISICSRWMNSFEAFLSDMGPRPSLLYTIDRINNDGNYEPWNCRWATRRTQRRNQARNNFLTYGGKTLCIAAWAEEVGLTRDTLYQRLKAGWSTEDILTRPWHSRNK